MSTNYYVVKKVNNDDIINEVKNILWCTSSFNIGDALKQYANARFEDKKIHIGSFAGNFKFLFNHNDCKYYEKTRISLDKFIRENDLFDEYGCVIEPDVFWRIVDSKKDCLDNRTYYTTVGSEYNSHSTQENNYHEEYSDGLRFSTSTFF